MANQKRRIVFMKTLLNERVAIRFWSKSKIYASITAEMAQWYGRLTINLRVSCPRTRLFTTSKRDMQCDKSHQLSEKPAKGTTMCSHIKRKGKGTEKCMNILRNNKILTIFKHQRNSSMDMREHCFSTNTTGKSIQATFSSNGVAINYGKNIILYPLKHLDSHQSKKFQKQLGI